MKIKKHGILKWISVDERLPDEQNDVLITYTISKMNPDLSMPPEYVTETGVLIATFIDKTGISELGHRVYKADGCRSCAFYKDGTCSNPDEQLKKYHKSFAETNPELKCEDWVQRMTTT